MAREAFSPFRVLGAVAIAAGVARIASSFLDWSQPNAEIEAFAFAIDVGLLLGLSGFYFANAQRLGAVGFIGYAIAAAGIAFITGPDGAAFGVDIYQMGVGVIAAGLLVLSAAMLMQKIARLAAGCWIASVVAGAGGGAVGYADAGFMIAGILLALGFIAVGLEQLRR
jgi:hypothetical protein